MPVDSEIPTHLNMRIDPKLRYLTELAARARSMSLTEYIEDALQASFKNVSIDPIAGFDEEPEVYELSPAERREKFRRRQDEVLHPLSEVADRLWSEHLIGRLQLLASAGLEHLMSEQDKHIWRHIFSRSSYKTKDGRLDLKVIEKEWTKIKFAAMTDMRRTREKGDSK